VEQAMPVPAFLDKLQAERPPLVEQAIGPGTLCLPESEFRQLRLVNGDGMEVMEIIPEFIFLMRHTGFLIARTEFSDVPGTHLPLKVHHHNISFFKVMQLDHVDDVLVIDRIST
jgi:hypothetical protein